jgi:hypothetical protein
MDTHTHISYKIQWVICLKLLQNANCNNQNNNWEKHVAWESLTQKSIPLKSSTVTNEGWHRTAALMKAEDFPSSTTTLAEKKS